MDIVDVHLDGLQPATDGSTIALGQLSALGPAMSANSLWPILSAKNQHPPKKVECKTCNKFYASKKSLKIHMRIHTGYKPYKCGICAKSFTQTNVLKAHMNAHTGQRDWVCAICGKAFTQSAHLRTHEKTHTNRKDYKCAFCQLSFSSKGVRDRHLRQHTGEKPYKCVRCAKTFTRGESLRFHENAHLGIRPYSCPEQACMSTFTKQSSLKRHVHSCHGLTPNAKEKHSPNHKSVESDAVNGFLLDASLQETIHKLDSLELEQFFAEAGQPPSCICDDFLASSSETYAASNSSMENSDSGYLSSTPSPLFAPSQPFLPPVNTNLNVFNFPVSASGQTAVTFPPPAQTPVTFPIWPPSYESCTCGPRLHPAYPGGVQYYGGHHGQRNEYPFRMDGNVGMNSNRYNLPVPVPSAPYVDKNDFPEEKPQLLRERDANCRCYPR